jgi:hypothetical protein
MFRVLTEFIIHRDLLKTWTEVAPRRFPLCADGDEIDWQYLGLLFGVVLLSAINGASAPTAVWAARQPLAGLHIHYTVSHSNYMHSSQ